MCFGKIGKNIFYDFAFFYVLGEIPVSSKKLKINDGNVYFINKNYN
jgi:hypothetical protein